MRTRGTPRLVIALGLALALGCTPAAGGRRGGTPGVAEASIEAYCAITARADLVAWEGALVTLCEPNEGDAHEARCEVRRVSSAGELVASGLSDPGEPIVRAVGLARGHAALELASGRLVLALPDGALRERAAHGMDAGASADGERLAWVEPEGETEDDAWEFGLTTRVMELALDAASPRLVASGVEASSPRPLGRDEVLWVSTEGGVAGFTVGAAGRAPERLTNVGQTEVGQDFVPVAGSRAAFSGGRLVYSVESESGPPHVMSLDPVRGEVIDVGPGDWPRPDGADAFVARQDAALERCALRYAAGGAP